MQDKLLSVFPGNRKPCDAKIDCVTILSKIYSTNLVDCLKLNIPGPTHQATKKNITTP
jgi:hypothetical protein